MLNGTPFLLHLLVEDMDFKHTSWDVFERGFMNCREVLIENGVIHALDDDFPDDSGYHIELFFHMTKNRFFTIIVLWVYDPYKAFELKMKNVPVLEKPLKAKQIYKKHCTAKP